MAWEQRGGKGYYYRSVRHGSRVIKTYMGKGPFIAMLVAEVEQERAERQAKAEAWLKARKDMEALDAQMQAWWDTSTALVNAALTNAGYYRHHRGEWRKRAESQRSPSAAQQGEQGR